MNILAIDLGSSKSVFGLSVRLGDKPTHASVPTTPEAFHDLILKHSRDRVVIQIGATAGWVHDLCKALGVPCEVANVADEMWRWNRTRKKTDKKDVDRMLFLAHSDSLPTVHMPKREVRQWRQLIRYRQELVSHQTQIGRGKGDNRGKGDKYNIYTYPLFALLFAFFSRLKNIRIRAFLTTESTRPQYPTACLKAGTPWAWGVLFRFPIPFCAPQRDGKPG